MVCTNKTRYFIFSYVGGFLLNTAKQILGSMSINLLENCDSFLSERILCTVEVFAATNNCLYPHLHFYLELMSSYPCQKSDKCMQHWKKGIFPFLFLKLISKWFLKLLLFQNVECSGPNLCGFFIRILWGWSESPVHWDSNASLETQIPTNIPHQWSFAVRCIIHQCFSKRLLQVCSLLLLQLFDPRFILCSKTFL